MNKTARYSLIASICAAHGFGPKLFAVVNPTRADTREEISLSVSSDDRKTLNGNDLNDASDLPALGSRLSFDSAKVRPEREENVLLSRTERAEIRRDLLAYRIREDSRLAKIHAPFALALISA